MISMLCMAVHQNPRTRFQGTALSLNRVQVVGLTMGIVMYSP